MNRPDSSPGDPNQADCIQLTSLVRASWLVAGDEQGLDWEHQLSFVGKNQVHQDPVMVVEAPHSISATIRFPVVESHKFSCGPCGLKPESGETTKFTYNAGRLSGDLPAWYTGLGKGKCTQQVSVSLALLIQSSLVSLVLQFHSYVLHFSQGYLVYEIVSRFPLEWEGS